MPDRRREEGGVCQRFGACFSDRVVAKHERFEVLKRLGVCQVSGRGVVDPVPGEIQVSQVFQVRALCQGVDIGCFDGVVREVELLDVGEKLRFDQCGEFFVLETIVGEVQVGDPLELGRLGEQLGVFEHQVLAAKVELAGDDKRGDMFSFEQFVDLGCWCIV